MLNLLLVLISVIFALQAVRCRRLIRSSLWLAGVSAILSILLYRLGAREVAVIELSVGAGLVTILMVFAIAIAGEDAMDQGPVVPHWLAITLVTVVLGAAAYLILPAHEPAGAVNEAPFAVVLWEQRGLDALVQIGLIFAGTLGVLGLLSEKETATAPSVVPQTDEEAAGVVPEGGAS